MIDKQTVLDRLDFRAFYSEHVKGLKVNGKAEALGLCPWHDDTTASLSVNIEKGLYHCFACDAKGDAFSFFQKAHGVDFQTALRELAEHAGVTEAAPVKQKVVASFTYRDAEGRALYYKERLEPGKNGRSKEFRFWREIDGKRVPGRGGEPMLYNLPAIPKADYAFLVEGEAKADLLASWGLPSTCLDSGASSPWRDEYTAPLKKVIILPDADTPGRASAARVARILHNAGRKVKVVELPGLSEKEDIIDWSKREGNDRKRLLEIVKAAPEYVPPAEPEQEVATPTVDSVPFVWEEPVLFGEIETPEIPASFLPAWLGEYAEAVARSTQTPSGMAVMLALSTASTCLQKRFEVSPYGDSYTEPLSLWTVTALPPASRKTAVITAMTEPLVLWEREQAEKMGPIIAETETKRAVNLKRIERLQAEAAKTDDNIEREILIKEIAELKQETPDEMRPPRLWTGDVTPERTQSLMMEQGEKIAVLSDEGGIFEVMAGQYSDGKVNIDVFLQAHAGKSVRVDRGSRTAHLHKPALAFGLAVQPSVIAELSQGSKRRFRGNGALARFLYCIPRSNIGSRDVVKRVTIPDTIRHKYHAEISNLLDIQPLRDAQGVEQPRILTLDPYALKAWLQFSQYIEANQGEGKEFESIQDWTGKLPGAALRIGGICHVVEHGAGDRVIKLPTMEQALDLCDLLIAHAKAAFDLMGADQAVDDAKIVFRWIQEAGKASFSRRECHKALEGRFRRVDRLMKALTVLEERHIINAPVSVRQEIGGRPCVIYTVNPAITERGQS